MNIMKSVMTSSGRPPAAALAAAASVRQRLSSARLGLALAALAAVLAAPAAAGAQSGPRLTNADVRTVAASGTLASQIRTLAGQQTEPVWIAYAQPTAKSRMQSCCWSDNSSGRDCCGACRLERDHDGNIRIGSSTTSDSSSTAAGASARSTPAGPIKLEGATEVIILARVAGQQVERVRIFSPDCELDAGGLRVHVLTGVTAASSLAWLESLVRDEPQTAKQKEDRLSNGAIVAIAMHRDAGADAALDRLVAPGRPRDVRRNALFWLANARGKHGFEVTQRIVRDDADTELRRHAVFCLTVSDEPGAIPVLLDAARNNPSPDVRGQALFWVANAAGKRAAATLTDAIANDPETQVKEKAVFALSQLPNKEGTPLLIEVAKNNRNPAVRKKAMFWLGQSKDPRALEFFETVLR